MFDAMTCGRRSILAALAVAIAMLPSAPAASQNQPRTIVALVAHADDETAAEPALARYAREGVQVYLIIATDGSGGSGTQTYLQRPDSGPVGDALAKGRADEARCAATALGAREAILLGFPDGKLGDYLGDRGLPFTPPDLDAAVQAMACHKTQFSAEVMQRFLPARDRVWNGAVAFVPASPALSGDDLFKK